jgi:hypothetical protein
MTVALGNNIALPVSSPLSYRLAFDTMGKLANYGKLGAAADPDAVIEALFANSELGAWYDPSDLTTMFQDRAGTTPVTADGQPVGLILDKSKGLVLGPEQCTNGDFASGSTGWVLGAEWSIASGEATYTGSGGWLSLVWSVSIPVGGYLKIEFDVVSIIPGTTGRVLLGGVPFTGCSFTTVGHKVMWVCSTTVNYSIGFDGAGSGAGTGYVIDNVSIKFVAGNHAVAPSDADRPLKTSTGLSDWINYDAVDDVVNSTFQSSLGSSCTVCRANVGAAPTILTAQTIGTSYADSTDHAGLIIINRALTGQETTDVTAWLLAKGATA